MWKMAIVMSGKVGSPREGMHVRESLLRRMRSELVRKSVIRLLCTYYFMCTYCVRVPGKATGVEVSHDDIVITEAKKKVKVRCDIGGTM